MKILRVLLTAERGVNPWLTISEIAHYADLPPEAVGSRIRDLRLDGFTIARARRSWATRSGRREWEYRIFYATQGK
jgi:hypothetical protein